MNGSPSRPREAARGPRLCRNYSGHVPMAGSCQESCRHAWAKGCPASRHPPCRRASEGPGVPGAVPGLPAAARGNGNRFLPISYRLAAWEEMSYKVQRPFPSALGAPAVAAGDALPGPARGECPWGALVPLPGLCRLAPALPSPVQGRVSGVSVSAHIPMEGLRCWELPWALGSSQGLECPCASTP